MGKNGHSKKEEPKPASALVALTGQTADLKALVADNLGGGGQISSFDLQRVKIPTGGGTAFLLPTAEGDESRQKLDCIIIAWQSCRAYWPDEFSGGTPPACTSQDGLHGVGDPGGQCAVCPYAQWKSDRDARGQACKAMRRLFLLIEGSILPYVLTLPPTSLKPCTSYFVKLLGAQRAFWHVTTIIGLEATKNQGGIAYSRATFAVGRVLTDAERTEIARYNEAIKPLFAAPVSGEDYASGGEDL